MIARLTNIERAFTEIRERKFTSIRIRPSDGKGEFGTRTNLEPEQVVQYLTETRNDFQGELIVELWSGTKPAQDDRTRYVLSSGNGNAAQVQGIGAAAGLHPMILSLLEKNHAKDMEILKMQLQADKDDGQVNYLKEAVGALRDLMGRMRGNDQPTPQPQRQEPQREQEQVSGNEAEEEDVLDRYMDVEPDGEEIIDRLIKLKQTDPAAYAMARKMLFDR